ncbi:hypothetical protein ACWDYJ_16810 [Streptomyces sp. NPDC003042]
MPIDPYTALNAMIRAEAARFAPPTRRAEQPAPEAATAETEAQAEAEQHQNTADSTA